ncbi:uroporphyrinogen-III synthase [Lutimaribacter pacificus]|uniref:Uroporphyrinogen-III synthase n=1 Tax=Lutimaribacter pacificus TaxID=391948 RepID=A0A1H0MAU6_9RHOB|nr:uroporphyrinogen-III synthase [Lutimaribacter pacificus]SDO77507.1 uroporphyrinogen-III synthase [Lutimaribacter pacificus]SHK99581.1 uroporphyrinogen-III synthase [Lutimaribacter pacificus]
MPTILLTRPDEGSARFAGALRDVLGPVGIVTSPILRIEGTGAVPDLSDDPVLIFTSRNGVEFRGFGPKQGLTCLCVGDATAEAAEAAGIAARSAGGDLRDLLALIGREPPDRPLLHIRGAHSAGDLVGSLQAMGLIARAAVVYDQVAQPLSAGAKALLAGDGAVVVPLFSPRSAAEFARQHSGRAPLYIAAISEAAARAASVPHAAMRIADSPTMEDMLAATCGLFDAAQSLEGGSRAQ